MDPVTHFEMPAKDKKRASKFYSTVFGWKLQQLGPEMGEYLIAHTTETDAQGMVKTPGNINGGFYSPTEDPLSQRPSVVIAVKDIQASMKAVTKNGGKILRDPDEIPGIGTWVSFADSEGNRVSMLQPKRM
ncbi:MAG: uncharacterized protein QOD77_1325 [Thermoplasmata archaeon]|jgi:predicted enzyme related to lactoylglutathione lyase|nr:uncharacterized protein [Thermoplasmata archaeon]